MKRVGALLLCTAAVAQNPLGDDLERAADRFPAAKAELSDDFDRLADEAAEHFRAGRLGEAVAALDRAAAAAYRAGAAGRSFELALTAAEALRAANRPAEAADRYRQAALGSPRDPRAPKAHAAAVKLLAAELAEERLDEYDQLLEEHERAWPDSPTIAEVRWERAELDARRGRWDAVLRLLPSLDARGERGERAAELLVTAHEAQLRRQPTEERFLAARDALQPLVFEDPGEWPATWSPVGRRAALALARGAMVQNAAGRDYARRLLRHALEGRPAPDAAWRREAGSLLAVLLVSDGDRAGAEAWLAQLTDAPLATRDALLRAMAASLQARTSLDEEAFRLARRLDALATGQSDVEGLRKLASERPDDHAAQAALARALGESATPADRDEALRQWFAVERRCEPHSQPWFEARLARLRLLADGGRREAAQKLLALTRLISPSLGGDAYRPRFEALGRELDASPTPPKVAPP